MATTTVDRSPASHDVRSPRVLVVLVTRDAVAWLRGCLESLAAQTHPRLGVVAVDERALPVVPRGDLTTVHFRQELVPE